MRRSRHSSQPKLLLCNLLLASSLSLLSGAVPLAEAAQGASQPRPYARSRHDRRASDRLCSGLNCAAGRRRIPAAAAAAAADNGDRPATWITAGGIQAATAGNGGRNLALQGGKDSAYESGATTAGGGSPAVYGGGTASPTTGGVYLPSLGLWGSDEEVSAVFKGEVLADENGVPIDASSALNGDYRVTVSGSDTSAAAAASPTRALITWYGSGSCTGQRTRVVFESGQCQRALGQNSQGYEVVCNAQGSGGVARFCNDMGCSAGCGAVNFTNGACLQASAQYGSLGYSVSCNTADIAAVTPAAGEVAWTWYAEAGCKASGGGTLMIAPSGACQAGYQVSCTASAEAGGAGNGTATGGVWATGCTTGSGGQACSVCANRSPWQNNVCVGNPGSTGSQSVSFSCAGVPKPPNDPSGAAGKTGGSSAEGGGTQGSGAAAVRACVWTALAAGALALYSLLGRL